MSSSCPPEGFKLLAAAWIIVLPLILLSLNAFAIWLRNRYQEEMVSMTEIETETAPGRIRAMDVTTWPRGDSPSLPASRAR